jgi:hypothetical protein
VTSKDNLLDIEREEKEMTTKERNALIKKWGGLTGVPKRKSVEDCGWGMSTKDLNDLIDKRNYTDNLGDADEY